MNLAKQRRIRIMHPPIVDRFVKYAPAGSSDEDKAIDLIQDVRKLVQFINFVKSSPDRDNPRNRKIVEATIRKLARRLRDIKTLKFKMVVGNALINAVAAWKAV